MATIARTTKAGSGTGDFAAATTIVASEANADLNTIYNEFNGSIAAANLASNAVTTAKILDANVTLAKLAVGATIRNFVAAAVTAGQTYTTVESTIGTSGAVTWSGGRVFIISSIGGTIGRASSGATESMTIRAKIDGVTTESRTMDCSQTTGTSIVWPICFPVIVLTPSAGSHTLILTVQSTSANVNINTQASNAGSIYFVELA